jgi:conjugative transposon TraN protein
MHLKTNKMKKISGVVMTGIFLVLTIFKSFSQNLPDAKAAFINPYNLAITFNKTTNLVFPYAIKSVDKGSRDVLVQKAIGVENILQVKAAKQGFPETDLTVVTADGSVYSYLLNYTDTPTSLSLVMINKIIIPKPLAVFAKDATNDEIQDNARLVSGKNRLIKRLDDESFGVKMDVKGLYIHKDVLYFEVELQNNSTINYDVQLLRFFIVDRKKVKRTASQEVDISPLLIWGGAEHIPANSTQTISIALPKFTIPDKKYLSVQLMEQNGGRNLALRIKNKLLMSAKAL